MPTISIKSTTSSFTSLSQIMRTIMAAKFPHETSFSFSKRCFNCWKKKSDQNDEDNEEEILTFNSSSHFFEEEQEEDHKIPFPNRKKIASKFPISKWPLTVFGKNRSSCYHSSLGTKFIGTLFGYRRGHVHFAFQEDPKLCPVFLIEISLPTSVLVKEMASGLVRLALECEKNNKNEDKIYNIKKGNSKKKLIEEENWRTYCNGKKCGFAMRRECGAEEWKVLKAVEPISIGGGVLPGLLCEGNGEDGSELRELMYMRARFERVVGSKDSEAFYMMNPDGSGGPELSIYLLRI